MLRIETKEEAAFRAEVRAWIAANLPRELRHLSMRAKPVELMGWYRALSARGWLVPHWPKAHGGIDATPVQQVILLEELASAGAPDLPMQGLTQIGPLLIKRGSEEQKRKHLPKILSGEVIWAQGYSEPGAGSDLASLRTRGTIEGGEIVINGQKTWNSGAQHAHWLYALVRTGEGKSRRDGITFVTMPADTPGITRRPIRTLAGEEELCEIFFDDVRVPLENVVGQVGDGWSVGNTLLAEERIRSGSPLHALRGLARLRMVARHTRADRDPWIADRIAQAELLVMVAEATYLDALERLQAGKTDMGDSATLKILGSETAQFVLEVLQEAAGEQAAVQSARTFDERHPDYSQNFIQSRKLSIWGGTNEIQRGIIAMRVLGLPRGAKDA